MLRVGITGGIGSGKSTACRCFEELGIPVYYADERARWLMENHAPLMEKIKESFGQDVYFQDGKLNRPLLADQVFGHAAKLQILNSLVHPAVQQDRNAFIQRHPEAPYTVSEAALLIEGGSYKEMDRLILVYAPEEERIQRVMQRDHTTAEKVRARMQHQLPDEEKIPHCHYIINNFGCFDIKQQVFSLHPLLLPHE